MDGEEGSAQYRTLHGCRGGRSLQEARSPPSWLAGFSFGSKLNCRRKLRSRHPPRQFSRHRRQRNHCRNRLLDRPLQRLLHRLLHRILDRLLDRFLDRRLHRASRLPIAFTPLSPERERALKPKDMFKECDKCPEMLVVPAGSFTMGSPESERVPIVAAWQSYGITPGTLTTGVALSSEGPQHKVVIAQPIAVGRFAVTFEEWDACVDDRGCNGYRPADQDWGRGSRPVINVNWNDAKAYVAWLSQKTGKKYRLLSEAEWEYIARAGTTTSFWWGSSFSTSQANYNGTHTYGGEPTGEDRQKTYPVEFSP